MGMTYVKYKSQMTPKERILAAMKRESVDYTPCAPLFSIDTTAKTGKGLRYNHPFNAADVWQTVEYAINVLEIDQIVFASFGGYYPDERVSSKIWLEDNVIHKTYKTPAGILHASVRYDYNWPNGLDIPFFNDFNTAHYIEPWLKNRNDLECMRYILCPPSKNEHYNAIKFNFEQVASIAKDFDVPIAASIGSGLTGAQQLFGVQQICEFVMDDPELVGEYLELEHAYNLKRIELAAELGVDIVIRNGFYESCDFYSPAMLEDLLGDRLRKEASAIRSNGMLSRYTLHTGILPMLEYLDKISFDCIYATDIAFDNIDITKVNEKLSHSKSFWTGPSSTYQFWSADTETVRKAVRRTFEVFGKQGLLLAVAPSNHSSIPWENTLAMIDEWKKLR